MFKKPLVWNVEQYKVSWKYRKAAKSYHKQPTIGKAMAYEQLRLII